MIKLPRRISTPYLVLAAIAFLCFALGVSFTIYATLVTEKNLIGVVVGIILYVVGAILLLIVIAKNAIEEIPTFNIATELERIKEIYCLSSKQEQIAIMNILEKLICLIKETAKERELEALQSLQYSVKGIADDNKANKIIEIVMSIFFYAVSELRHSPT